MKLLGIRERRGPRNQGREGVELLITRPSGTLIVVDLSNDDLLRLIREAASFLVPAAPPAAPPDRRAQS